MNTEFRKITRLLMDTEEGDNWTGINVQQVLKDIPAEKATKKINADHLNIAELTAHLSCWNNVMVRRLEGQKYQPSKEEDLPVFQELSEEEWNNLKQEFTRSFHALKDKLETLEDAILDEPVFEGASSAYRNLHGQISHLHYHLGQIVLLKKIL